MVLLVNPGYAAAELGHLVSDSGAVLAFADPAPATRLASLASRDAVPLPVAPVAGLPAGGDRAGRGVRHKSVVRPADAALLADTSGTTGRRAPRAVASVTGGRGSSRGSGCYVGVVGSLPPR